MRVVTAKTRAMLQTTTGTPPVTAPPSVGSTPTASRAASSAGEPVGQPASRGFAWSNATTPLTPPGLPPGLTRGGSSSGSSQRSTGGRSAWGEPAASYRSASPLPAPTSAGASSGDDPMPKTPGADEPDMVAGSRIEGALVALSVDDYEDDIYLGIDGEPTDYVGASDVLYMPNANAVSPSGPSIPDAAIQNEDNRESDDDDDDDDLPQMVGDKKICPEHNVVCNKGICRVYAAMLREEKREKERQEREKARAEAKAKREKAQNKRGKNSFFKPLPSSGPNFPTSPSGREPPPHLRAGAPPPSSAPRPLPPHLKPGAPPPTPSSSAPKQMPAHLQRGASASSQPRPAPDPAGRVTPTPSRQGGESDERSEAGGWDNASEGPWGSYAKPPDDRKKNWAQAKTFVPAAGPPKAPSHGQEFGAWGKAPSVSASSVRRNNDSWSVSAPSEAGDGDAGTGDGWQTTVATEILKNKPTGREFGAWGKAPSVTASSVRRNNDSWSVSAPSEVGDTSNDNDNGWRTATESKAKKKDKKKEREFGAWGKAPSVSASSVRRNHDSWSVSARSDAGGPGADGHHDDARSVAASDDGNWGRPPSVVGQAGRSWADQMDEEDEANAAPEPDDDARSVAASTVSGWGSVSAGPW
ncbi:hypothetical protein PYCCODRAFT_1003320 [Trametes coccinea BRFM310]|uniref:Uncharacterized protein n=1 Tax=Trametes coccinea (strain BRFM310) TaxID=1353009 RepID=A0A1Y2IBJ9_TRAC3|nr:hypothetical protein PYCCODRAFT_1003320 [Trametes coccinea BRFM310]